MPTQAALNLDPRVDVAEEARTCEVISIDQLAAARRRREQSSSDSSPLTLRCVHSDHLGHTGSCAASVPFRVVAGAWRRERLERLLADGFFRLQWRGEVWLGYGMADGQVRGVYCPEHNARRSHHYYRQAESCNGLREAGLRRLSVA